MNSFDVLKYGQLTLLHELEEFPREAVLRGGACGYWSVKDIIAHLASYEVILVDVLNKSLGKPVSGRLAEYLEQRREFNDIQVDRRKNCSLAEVLDELNQAHAQVLELIQQVPEADARRPGTLPWYGAEYALEDYLVYQFYGHKREHSAQIAAFRDLVVAGKA